MIPLYDSIFYWIEDCSNEHKKRSISIKKKTKTTWAVALIDEHGLKAYSLHHNLETAIGTALNEMRQLQTLLKSNKNLVY